MNTTDVPNGTQLKTVHANVWDSTKSLFKKYRNERAEVQVILCGCPEGQCDLLKAGQCSFRASFGWHACPYGTWKKYEGPTPRARKYREWLKNEEEKYKGVPYLKDHTDMIAFVGDYVFLPYAHMDMSDAGFIQKSFALFGKGCAFLKKELFTLDNIEYLIAFRPQALMGGEITSYQNESVPKFVKHLEEKCPELFEELYKRSERVRSIITSYSYVKRKAFLNTLTPNVGKFKDIHGGEWLWDGEYLTSPNSHASFMLVDRPHFSEIKVKPKPEAVVEITDNGQVNPNTKFLT